MPDTTELFGPEDSDIWKSLWDEAHSSHYLCYYHELLAEALVGRWQFIDTISKILTSITAAGSAVAASIFWTTNVGASCWSLVSIAAAVFTVLQTTLSISTRIKDDTLVHATFQKLRLEVERFRNEMRFRNFDSLAMYKKEYMALFTKLEAAHGIKRPDFLITSRLENKVQEDLNKRLGY